jgi:2,4-dienoyl-CoA reductase-like NADH-dependent reductase (Old Yellow Enzyme family)
MSLWDACKHPVEEAYAHRPLMAWFTDLPRGNVRLGVAGKIMSPAVATALIEGGADFVFIGRGAILHHDWPSHARRNAGFEPVPLPVSAEYLANEGLGPRFIRYMRTWENFVSA